MVRDVASGETRTIESGTQSYSDGYNLQGQLNIAGEANIGGTFGASASGTGTGLGTADATAVLFATADGYGLGLGTSGRTLQIDSGTTETIPSQRRDRGEGINVGGELNLGGTVDAAQPIRGVATRFRETSASGIGTGTGTADADAVLFASADGVGEGFGDAVPTFIRALIRGGSFDIDYDETESFDLNADSDGDGT